ncbi:hypothetical protein GOV14_01295 [Candidatus Pacearchaeota archaeon]|nr:hypothetical protein [Candidatus Pacearchaeota archaeon]
MKYKKNVTREGLIFLYRAQWGVRLIKHVGTNYKKTLKVLKWVIIVMSYLLMIAIVYFILRSAFDYIMHPWITEIIKAPPLAPVIPYFPKLFGMQEFMPAFPFTYFLFALAIVAIVHEFSHGIYMVFNKVRIKSTGFAFFGPFMGAFVEQNDKDMNKLKRSDHMSILGAGVFANIIFGIIFLLIWIGLFYVTFIPSGVPFNMYSLGPVVVTNITSIAGLNVSSPTNVGLLDLINENDLDIYTTIENEKEELEFIKVKTGDDTYFVTEQYLAEQLGNNQSIIGLHMDLPAINNKLRGIIIEVDGQKISHHEELINVMKDKKPGQKINIKTNFKGEIESYDIELAKDDYDEDRAIIGIMNNKFTLRIDEIISINWIGMKKANTHYTQRSEFLAFLYGMMFWTFSINFLVALFNMLPAIVFFFIPVDGGLFFYQTMLILTKNNKRLSTFIFKLLSFIINMAFVVMMVVWAIRFF